MTLFHTEDHAGFTVRFYAEPEDLSPADSFGDETLADALEGIASGRYLWFAVRVTASKDGVVLGEDTLGGCCYESYAAFLAPGGYAEDMRDAAIADAEEHEKQIARADRDAEAHRAYRRSFVNADPLNALIAVYEAWLADPAQAPIKPIEGDAEELILHVNEMCLTTQEGDEERALRGATKAQAEVWRVWLNAFIALWEATA